MMKSALKTRAISQTMRRFSTARYVPFDDTDGE